MEITKIVFKQILKYIILLNNRKNYFTQLNFTTFLANLFWSNGTAQKKKEILKPTPRTACSRASLRKKCIRLILAILHLPARIIKLLLKVKHFENT